MTVSDKTCRLSRHRFSGLEDREHDRLHATSNSVKSNSYCTNGGNTIDTEGDDALAFDFRRYRCAGGHFLRHLHTQQPFLIACVRSFFIFSSGRADQPFTCNHTYTHHSWNQFRALRSPWGPRESAPSPQAGPAAIIGKLRSHIPMIPFRWTWPPSLLRRAHVRP